MKYWLTTHYPPRKGEPENSNPGGIYLKAKYRDTKDVQPGDKVVVVELANGDPFSDYQKGLDGMIALVEAVSPFRESEQNDKNNGWDFKAETKILSTNGFVDRVQAILIYGNKKKWGRSAGLWEINAEKYEQFCAAFNPTLGTSAIGKVKNFVSKISQKRIESAAHLNLKEFVAALPDQALQHTGLRTIGVEFSFCTNDRADIVLKDKEGCYIGVEIEIEQDDHQEDGLLQAIKYRFMLAPRFRIDYAKTRAFLVAHKLSQKIKQLAEQYDVEWFEVERDMVAEWVDRNKK